eukprot:GILI01018760.1.p1 GENE.GILI01018760.1~~GILI01018760.1.p1  ORF type:complete len:558 (-),score=100.07 GILI01018760.1:110-1723(-)
MATGSPQMVYIPTADEVNAHTLSPVDKIQPYDYRKHIPNHMHRKLEQRRDQISSEVAHKIGDSFGLDSHDLLKGIAAQDAMAPIAHQIPKPPSFDRSTIHSPIMLRPSTARHSPRSSPANNTIAMSPSRPQSSPQHRLSNASSSQDAAQSEAGADGPIPVMNSSFALSVNRSGSIVDNSTHTADASPSRGAHRGPIPITSHNTLPSEAEVQQAMAMLRERSNASPNGVPFLVGSGTSSHHRRPVSAGPSFTLNHKNAVGSHFKNDTSVSSVNEASAIAKGSWAGVASANPAPRLYTGVQRIISQPHNVSTMYNASLMNRSFGGAGLGAGVGLYNPADVTASWMIADSDKADTTGNLPSSPRARGQSAGSRRQEPLATPKAPLLRRACVKSAATFASTAAAEARRAHELVMRKVDVDKELERIAAATVRMQADHEHRKAIRQRRYLQGLAIRQPYEVAHFANVVSAEWSGVEAQRDLGVVDDIPSQVLQQQKGSTGGKRDTMVKTGLVASAVRSARNIQFEREIRLPQDQYTPRRTLM